MAIATTKLLTIDEFAARYEGRAYELIAGVPTPVYYDDNGKVYDIAPTGGRHQIMVTEISHQLREFSRKIQAGVVLSGEGGIYLERNPDTTVHLTRPMLRMSIFPQQVSRLALGKPRLI